jgi:PAS domain S-box-containing protein
MDRTIHILHLEDDPNDVELVRRTLAGDGQATEVRVVATRDEFLTALEKGHLDLILSDYALPGFDGMTALGIARREAPDVPFILVSGTLGEETAIESLRAGATDYILKDRLSRLPSAVERALAEAQERRRLRQAETRLHEEQQFLKAVLESLQTGIVTCDADGILTLFNRAGREMHGLPQSALPPDRWSEAYGLCRADGKTPLPKEEIPLYRALRGEQVQGAEMAIVPKDGEARMVVASGRPIIDERGRRLGAVVAMQDVTEQKRLEAQLRQALKMEAVGRLAGGVAHDFNNLLGVIIGYGQIVLGRMAADDPQRDKIDQIVSAADRAASLTRQLLAFSRKQVVEPRVLDLNDLLKEMEKMLRRLIGEDIELVAAFAPRIGRVKADPGQIEQIVMNLAVNARDAMPVGGRLTIETADAELDDAYARRHPGARPGRYVMLGVTDTGAGMSPEVQARIFEPFFTTKEMGHGTGLGLATVYGIVKQNDGFIEVQSEPERGATFKVYLPRVDQAADRPARRGTTATPRGTETVLVVEDEERVRDVIRQALEGYGYTVLLAEGAEQALEIGGRRETGIDLLLTDVILPRMNGREVARRIVALRPSIRVLYMSGYTDSGIVQHGILGEGVAFLQKPFPLTTLARKVREVLDAPAGASTP